MPAMNPNSFIKVMNLLNLAAVDIAQALYVSPSHVSRWKTGFRALKVSSAYFQQLVDLFLSVNERLGTRPLERFLLPDFDPARTEPPPEDSRSALRQRLLQFLTQQGEEARVTHTVPDSAVQVLVGLESRIEALKQFFEYVLTLSPKPDLYIKEVLYASWCPRYLDWFSVYHDYALRYMDAGGVIYYFSNLYPA